MQVLVLAVQNAVDYKLLGSATSGVTMLRGIGGSIGTAALGAIFTSRLTGELKSTLHGPLAAQVSKGARLTGAQVARLPAGPRSIYQHAYVHSLRPAFLVAAAAAVLGFVLSLFLQERKLRGAPATSTGLEDGLAAPRSADSLAEIERSLTRVTTAEERTALPRRVARAGGSAAVLRRHLGAGPHPASTAPSGPARWRAPTGSRRSGSPPSPQELRGLGLLVGGRPDGGGRPRPGRPRDGAAGNGQAELTATGREHAERLLSARCELLTEALADDGAERDPQVLSLLRRLSVELCGDPPSVEQPAAAT